MICETETSKLQGQISFYFLQLLALLITKKNMIRLNANCCFLNKQLILCFFLLYDLIVRICTAQNCSH